MNLQRPRVLNFTNRVAKIVSEKGTAALKSYRLPHIGFDRKEVCTWAQVMLKASPARPETGCEALRVEL
jgi:hypothetical protein